MDHTVATLPVFPAPGTEEYEEAVMEYIREKNRTKARVTRERRKIQFKELEVALEASVVLLRTLREEFKQHTGREFHSEGIVLYAAVCEFRCSRRGGARERTGYTYSDKLEQGRLAARTYRQRKKALEILMDGCYSVISEENSAIRAYLDGLLTFPFVPVPGEELATQSGDGGAVHDGTEGLGEIAHDLGGEIGVIDGYTGLHGGVEFVDEGAEGEACTVDVTGVLASNTGSVGEIFTEMETTAGVDG